MGLLTWVLVGVIVLAVIGLGWGVFFSGLYRGAQVVSQNPLVKNVTQDATKTIENATNTQLGSPSNVLVVHTERTVYKLKEPVIIVVKNEGDEKVSFSDSTPSVEIKNKETGKTYDVTITHVKTNLEPGQSLTITWDQTGDVNSGDYTAVVKAENGTKIGETTFTIET
jgi:uncharacterized cupredoxin-like copper-binding protein